MGDNHPAQLHGVNFRLDVSASDAASRHPPGRIQMWCWWFAWRAEVGQQCPRGARGTQRAQRAGAARGVVFGARG
jgi:hypothetical protein